ncbi:MAG TPA: type II toxin-antitoxin system HicA family toxin [Candidatus Lambdaproteobacteria bacterium]|uniref:Type II toxin-antitoxin system HicA family toxin n=1 Tax=SAR324 cluster bacterium TaxID=2024889 RepID=A0A432H936_9DELT|nr:type II toxin-antitoxin system HicA family toxin [SAR324 cluster bacterium]HBD28892.1 hypothetical protein [Deltaproteobacteria bacterium]HHZ87385.1 type II toxin-antitoxin system HicA family toxin [Candidatus Lambdaproteobacteria bacterium]RTZ85204.1 MAG: hypothetical protein DSY96_05005 [SAR324 cluster bacterium]RTZ92223.1 MAG: hypothetical protein DSY93_01955 [SAR324 cluster bacterium]
MPFKYREIERNLKKMGFQVVRQKGSHVIFSNGRDTFPVPKSTVQMIYLQEWNVSC